MIVISSTAVPTPLSASPTFLTGTTTGEAPESDTISFAVRSFVYLTTSADKDSGESLLSAEEERTLGKKLASGIRAIAGEKPLYLAYPEDAAQFLQIWAHYGSREETDRYLKKSFKPRPENAVALLKFRFEKEGDKVQWDPVERAIAYQFVRLHYDIKK